MNIRRVSCLGLAVLLVLFYPAMPAKAAPSEIELILQGANVTLIVNLEEAKKLYGGLKNLKASYKIADQLQKGEYDEAAYNAAKLALKTYAASEAGKELLKAAIGSNGPFLIGLTIKAVDLAVESRKALSRETAGRRLETLYQRVGFDPAVRQGKVDGREIGEGDPILINSQSIDYVYEKLRTNKDWEGEFKLYVEGKGQTWPAELSMSELVSATWAGKGAAVDKAIEGKWEENRNIIRGWIRDLLVTLNFEAKAQEAEAVLRIQAAAIDKALIDTAALITRMEVAAKRDPEIKAFVLDVSSRISDAIAKKDFTKMHALRAEVVNAVRIDIMPLPQTPLRKEFIAILVEGYNKLNDALKSETDVTLKKSLDVMQKQAQENGTAIRWTITPVKAGFTSVEAGIARLAATKSVEELGKTLDALQSELWNQLNKWQGDYTKNDPGDFGRANPTPKEVADILKVPGGHLEPDMRASFDLYNNQKITFMYAEGGRYGQIKDEITDYASARGAMMAQQVGVITSRLEQIKSAANNIKILGQTWYTPPENTGFRGQIGSIADAGRFLDGFKGPADEYRGLPKLEFPKWEGFPPQNILSYLMKVRYANQLDKYSGEQQSWDSDPQKGLTFARGMVDLLQNQIKSVDQLKIDLVEVKALIAKTPWAKDVDVRPTEAAVTEVETLLSKVPGWNNKVTALEAKAKEQRVSAEWDAIYLKGLDQNIITASKTLEGLFFSNVSYQKRSREVVWLPDAGTDDTKKRTYMNAREIEAQVSRIQSEFERQGLLRFDEKAQVGLKAELDKFIKRLRDAQIPAHYMMYGALLITNDDLSGWAKAISAIPIKSDSSFELYKALGAVLEANPPLDRLASVSLDSDTVSCKTDGLKTLANQAWDGTIKTDLQGVNDAFSKKIAEFTAYVAEEKRKQEEKRKKETECAQKGGILQSDGQCKTLSIPGQPGQPGQTGQPGQPGQTGQPGQKGQPSQTGQQAGMGSGMQQQGAGGKGSMAAKGQMPSNARQQGQGGATPAGQKGSGQSGNQFSSGAGQQGALQGQMGSLQGAGMGPLASASSRNLGGTAKTEDLTPKVKDLYNRFKQAYGSKDVNGVIRCLSSQWESNDGASVGDLQRHLQKTFRMFDEIKFNIQNLQINKVVEGKYRVSYDADITSRIYKRNLKHEEKSSISEEVTIESGQAKISKTLGGKLLYVK